MSDPQLHPDRYRFRPANGGLDAFDTADTGPFPDEDAAQESVEQGAQRLGRLHHILQAHGTHGLLLIFQGMDAAGKDEAIHHVMAAVDPQACTATQFLEPSEEEAQHDYLRRASQALPARGEIAIFNRSYYEQVVAERVHPEQLEQQNLPDEAQGDHLWEDRYRQINAFERYLVENGIRVLKFFFHISNEAQRQRLLERIERPEKRWDFSESDVEERDYWDDYMDAYEQALEATSTERAPWYVIPADHKWFGRALTAAIVIDALESLHSDYPELSDEDRQKLEAAHAELERQG